MTGYSLLVKRDLSLGPALFVLICILPDDGLTIRPKHVVV